MPDHRKCVGFRLVEYESLLVPADYIILNEGRLVLEACRGRVPHKELIDFKRKQLQDERIQPGAVALGYALAGSFPEGTADNIHELVDVHHEPTNKTSISRYAILVANETWPLAKLYEAEGARNQLTIVTCSSLDTACAYLGADKEVVQRGLDELLERVSKLPDGESG